MKWYKRIGAFMVLSTSVSYIIGSTMPLYLNALSESEDDWLEETSVSSYNTWRQDIETDFKAYDWIKANYDKEITSEENVHLNPNDNLKIPEQEKTPSYPIKTCGSMLYAMSKLMVATGAADEYSEDNADGVNPLILYVACMIAPDEVKKRIEPFELTQGYLYSANVDEWVDNPEYLIETINYYWGDKLNIDQVSSIRKSKEENKREFIQDLMDDGKYVIVSVDDYSYWDTESDTVKDGDKEASNSGYENPKHSILLTGYTEDDDGNFIDFTMDDSLSPAENFLDVYTYESIAKVSTFTTLPGIDSKLDFYINKENAIPWYLKLVSKESPVLKKDTKLLPIIDVKANTGKKILSSDNKETDILDEYTDDSSTDEDNKSTTDNKNKDKSDTNTGSMLDSLTDFISKNPYKDVKIPVDDRIESNLSKMIRAMTKDCSEEISALHITAGYRSFEEQKELYESAKKVYSDSVDLYEAKEGESEHNMGFCIDFAVDMSNDKKSTDNKESDTEKSSNIDNDDNDDNPDKLFENTDCFKWLCSHAHEYGFILRYPDGDTAQETTGRKYDPTHWRYIGIKDATEFIKFIDADYEEDEDGNIVNVDAYLNMGYNDKVFEDYFKEVIENRYATDEESKDGEEKEEDLSKKQKYSDAILRRVYYLLRHPVKAIGNFFAGLAQLAHNAIAVGKTGNLFNISWIINWDFLKPYIKYFIIWSTVVVVIGLVFRYIKYMFKSGDNIYTLIRDNAMYFIYGILPLLLLNFVGNCFNSVTRSLSSDLMGRIIMTEAVLSDAEEEKNAIEEAAEDDGKISAMEILTDEDLALTLFRETFSDGRNGYSYSDATIKMPMTDSKGVTIYKDIPVMDLFDTVSWETYKETMYPERVSSGATATITPFNPDDYVDTDEDEDDTNDKNNDDKEDDRREINLANVSYNESELLDNTSREPTKFETTKDLKMSDIEDAYIDPAVPQYLYYSCNKFVPVHYNYYDDSVFYYFYDWIRYQYLAYWAYSDNSKGEVISNFAQKYVLPGEHCDMNIFTLDDGVFDGDETFESYLNRMDLLESEYITKSKSGVYLMYGDKNYVKNDTDYYNDLFGLSNLFNMTTTYTDVNGTTHEYKSPDKMYYDTNSLDVWAGAVRVNYLNNMPTYEEFRNMVISGDTSYIEVPVLSSLINGLPWKVYQSNSLLKGKANGMSSWKFSPDYLDSKIDYDDNNRIPWRLHASERDLYNAYDDASKIKSTDLERKLSKLNKSIYKDVYKASMYMPGQVTDDVMIFVAALIATSQFNEMFDTNINSVYPKNINSYDLDMDKLTRLTYADNLVSTQSLDTMYMIYDSPGGLFVVLMTLVGEFLMLLSSIARMGILIMFFIASCMLAVNLMRGKSPITSTLFTGVSTQFVALLLTHIGFISTVMITLNILIKHNNGILRIGVSSLSMLLYFVIAIINIAMLMIFIKDMKHYGGMLLKDAINTVKSEVSDSESNNNPNATVYNAELEMMKRRKMNNELIKHNGKMYNKVYEDKLITASQSISSRNIDKMFTKNNSTWVLSNDNNTYTNGIKSEFESPNFVSPKKVINNYNKIKSSNDLKITERNTFTESKVGSDIVGTEFYLSKDAVDKSRHKNNSNHNKQQNIYKKELLDSVAKEKVSQPYRNSSDIEEIKITVNPITAKYYGDTYIPDTYTVKRTLISINQINNPSKPDKKSDESKNDNKN